MEVLDFQLTGDELEALSGLVSEFSLAFGELTMYRLSEKGSAPTLVVTWWANGDGGGQRRLQAVIYSGKRVAVSGPGIDDEG